MQAELDCGHGQANPGIARRRFDNHTAGFQATGLERRQHHVARHAVFDTAAGIVLFNLQ
ncbi:hypothetical protein D3C78_1834680 [compost metagenome]